MNKELLKEFQLQAGGSHYPGINPDMQEKFAKLIIEECIRAVKETPRHSARTTHDLSTAESTIEDCVRMIQHRFQL